MLKAPDRQTFRMPVCVGTLCFLLALASSAQDLEHPASGYLEASLRTGVDAGHAKADQAFQAIVLSWWSIADCTLLPGARVYGKIVSAVRHTKSSPESSLALLIESTDCQNHPNTPMALHILEIVAPEAPNELLHAVLPHGPLASSPAAGIDDDTQPDPESSSVRIGAVLGEGEMRLGIAEGPHFAEVLHSKKRTVSLLAGTRLILGTPQMIPPDQQVHFHPDGQQP
jgi:hypothetical protein